MKRAAGRRRLVLGIASAGALVAAGGWWNGSTWLSGRRRGVLIGDGSNGPLRMAWVPPGTFLMGSTSRRALPNEGPAHPVTLTGFWMSQTDVTNAEFSAFTEATGKRARSRRAGVCRNG